LCATKKKELMSLNAFTSELRDNTKTDTQKYIAFTTFVTYYNTLVTATLGTRTYSNEQLSQHIFKRSWKQSLETIVFEKHLYSAKKTLDRFSQYINATNISEYEFTLNMLAYDLFPLVAHVETTILNNTLSYQMGSRPDQSAREVFDVCRIMFHIGTINPANLYVREIIPVSVFLMRQAIEIYGKRLVGFNSITDEQGNRARYVSTQVAWDFIKSETQNENCRIHLPVNIDIIRRVETWSNHYVHTGNIPDIYLIDNAIQFIWALIYPQNSTERNYKNSIHFSGTSSIDNYNSVKEDFEKFVNKKKTQKWYQQLLNWILIKLKRRKEPKINVVNWLNVDQVDATIKTL
jgi:hypothetical protein